MMKNISQDLGLCPLQLPKMLDMDMFTIGSCFPKTSGFAGFFHDLYFALFWSSKTSSPELQHIFFSIIPMQKVQMAKVMFSGLKETTCFGLHGMTALMALKSGKGKSISMKIIQIEITWICVRAALRHPYHFCSVCFHCYPVT